MTANFTIDFFLPRRGGHVHPYVRANLHDTSVRMMTMTMSRHLFHHLFHHPRDDDDDEPVGAVVKNSFLSYVDVRPLHTTNNNV